MTVVWSGLAIGAVYALVAITLNLPLAQAGVFNLAQAQLMVLGTFIAYAGLVTFGLPAAVVVVAGAVICGLLAFVEDLVAIRPLAADSHHGTLVTTVGFFVIVEGVIMAVWGVDHRSLDFFAGNTSFSFAGGRVAPVDITIVIVAILLAVVLHAVSTRTGWGLRG
ncbi:branched-chain amino acid ABC transporter permease, partial [Amycolatopsis acidicola]